MVMNIIEQASERMKLQDFSEALNLLKLALEKDPSLWNAWYLAGQCCRFLNKNDDAITYLTNAVKLNADQAPVFLALGITYQLQKRWDPSVDAFRKAINIDPDYELAFNSLALTQKKAGSLEKALHNFDAGVKALSRRLVKAMKNSRSSYIIKHTDFAGSLWLEYSLYAGIFLVSSQDDISGVSWPTGDQAMEEERTEEHEGLFWEDLSNEKC